jgi:ribosomal protein S27E
MIAHYNKRVKELSGKPDPSELYDFLLISAPFLKEHEETKNKKDVFDKYMKEINGDAFTVEESSFCKWCKSENVHFDETTSDLICSECGNSEYTMCGERSYKEEQENDQTIIYSYKRENHFNEWIAQFQAKEVTSVPPDVFSLLREEFKKQKLKSNDITHSKVRELLKKLKLSKFYEHIPYISSILNGITPPQMDSALEDKLRNMFFQIQKPFAVHCPPCRKNFLSYSYILYKFCELLSKDDFLKCFPLLKSKEKLYVQDQIWKKITIDLDWEFIPTV